MLRQSVLGLGVAAAVCMQAASASAAGYNLRCSGDRGPVRQGDPPWITATIINYRIDLYASTVNGETVQIERRDVNGPKLSWNKPASATVPAAHYFLDLETGGLFVSFDKFELDDQKFILSTRRLRCTNQLLKIAA
jgi:hypothetical protein